MNSKKSTVVSNKEPNTNISNNSINELTKFNSDEEFEKIKAYPVNRTFNSLMALMVIVIFIGIGVIIGCLILFLS